MNAEGEVEESADATIQVLPGDRTSTLSRSSSGGSGPSGGVFSESRLMKVIMNKRLGFKDAASTILQYAAQRICKERKLLVAKLLKKHSKSKTGSPVLVGEDFDQMRTLKQKNKEQRKRVLKHLDNSKLSDLQKVELIKSILPSFDNIILSSMFVDYWPVSSVLHVFGANSKGKEFSFSPKSGGGLEARHLKAPMRADLWLAFTSAEGLRCQYPMDALFDKLDELVDEDSLLSTLKDMEVALSPDKAGTSRRSRMQQSRTPKSKLMGDVGELSEMAEKLLTVSPEGSRRGSPTAMSGAKSPPGSPSTGGGNF